jgi:lysophospholipase L1-like esterase
MFDDQISRQIEFILCIDQIIVMQMLPTLPVFLLALLLQHCTQAPLPQQTSGNPPSVTSEKRYLALGDSYTIGHGELTEQSFPFLLQLALQNLNIPFKSAPKVIARTGWTCDELSAAIAGDSTLVPPYDIVTLLIGVNDQYRGYDINLYNGRFAKLVDKAIELAGNRADKVIVLSIPDYGVTPFGRQRNSAKISAEIDAYNAINQTVAAQKAVHYIHITDISRQAGADSTLLVSDKLHPSGRMYRMWVDRMLPKALEIVK